MTDLSLKTINVSYTDKTENSFAVLLFKYLRKRCKIKVETEYFSSIDITIIDRQDPNNKVYIELKCRNDAYKNFKTFIIGYNKMINIKNRQLNPAILVWKFSDCFYFCDYSPEFCQYKTKVIQNSKVIYIDKNICSCGIEALVTKILNILNLPQ
jgi:hypothetical protein